MKRIAIVIGHNAGAQGAVRCTDGRTEYDWNSDLAKMIEAHDPTHIKVFRRKRGGGYSAEIDRVYAEVDAWGADVSVELHFNGSTNPAANGCLMLSSGTSGSRALAANVQKACVAALGNKDRGVRFVGKGDRGGLSLWAGRAPAILTEPYFGSNKVECEAADARKAALAKAIYDGARA